MSLPNRLQGRQRLMEIARDLLIKAIEELIMEGVHLSMNSEDILDIVEESIQHFNLAVKYGRKMVNSGTLSSELMDNLRKSFKEKFGHNPYNLPDPDEDETPPPPITRRSSNNLT